MRFEGKRAVVTGGASGIGRATALRLANEGAHVLVGDIDEAGGEDLVIDSAARIAFRRTDVTKEADIAALIAAAGELDILVNNAGAGGAPEPIGEIEADAWDRTQALLLRSVALGIKHGAAAMQGRGGAIVNVASIAALGTGAAPTAYSVAKAGVLHLTHCAATDLARYGIRVNAVCPGFIVTNIFTRHLGIEGEARTQAQAAIAKVAASAQPVARAGRPEDIAAAITFLASEDASFITGAHLVVDGGMTLGPRHSWDPDAPSLMTMIERMR
jgi:NAD(P)-dependent dehydrogenase (short-subunit alcohol dehydrogenase family)